jgi:hypothetical protein
MPNLKTKIAAAAAEPRLKTHLPMAPTLTGWWKLYRRRVLWINITICYDCMQRIH